MDFDADLASQSSVVRQMHDIHKSIRICQNITNFDFVISFGQHHECFSKLYNKYLDLTEIFCIASSIPIQHQYACNVMVSNISYITSIK